MEEINRSVPYTSQWDDEASDIRDDCGSASIDMILSYYGENYTVNDIVKRTGVLTGLVSVSALMKAIKSYGFNCEYLRGCTPDFLKSLLVKNIIPIALVHYGDLSSRQDQNFKGGHFFVPVGFRNGSYFVNDPDFWGAYRKDGDHHNYISSEFEKAWGNCHLDQNPDNTLLVIYPKNYQETSPSEPQITDQTKVYIGKDSFGNTWGDAGYMEVQAIRGTLNDQKKDIVNLKEKLTHTPSSSPSASPSMSLSSSVSFSISPSQEIPETLDLIPQLVNLVKKILIKLGL